MYIGLRQAGNGWVEESLRWLNMQMMGLLRSLEFTETSLARPFVENLNFDL